MEIIDRIVEKLVEKNNMGNYPLYETGIRDALELLNTPVKPMISDWCPSECPTCLEDFHDYEPCDDGYYTRAYNLERCPNCGQKLKWYD